jgi:hypothetical protein
LGDKLARIFVSSTFRDMHRERDILARSVFPRLRERCQGRGVALFEVDLRWGITEDLAQSRGTLRLCLDEIEACQPFFLCMLGQYGGWRPPDDELHSAAALDLPVAECSGLSITELEIRHALAGWQRNAQPTPRPIFLLRGRRLSEHLAGPADDDPAMDTLKSFIRSRPEASVHEYADFDAFERTVEAELTEGIEAWLRGGAQLPSRQWKGVTRARYAAALARDTSHRTPAILTGPQGCGTSWLGERWVETGTASGILIDGRDTAGGGLATALHAARVTQGLLPQGATQYAGSLEDELHGLASDVERVGREVNLLVDHFEDAFLAEAQADLASFPLKLPRGLRILIGTRSERLITLARDMKLPVLSTAALSREEAAAFATDYLLEFGKRLSAAQAEILAASPLATNVSALVLCLEELRRYGQFEALGNRVSALAGLQTPKQVMLEVLAGLRANLPEPYRDVADRILISLDLSRRGLTETEVCANASSTASQPLPPRVWSTVRIALARSIAWRGVRVDLVGRALRHVARELTEQRPELASQVGEELLIRLRQEDPQRWVEEAPHVNFTLQGESGLAEHLRNIEVVATLARAFPSYAAGWLEMLTPEARRGVTAQWWRDLEAAPGERELAWDLGYLAAQAGAREEARALWQLLEQSGQPSDRQIVQAVVLRDAKLARTLAPLEPPHTRIAEGGETLFKRWTIAASMLALAAQGLLSWSREQEAAWVNEARDCARQLSDDAASAQVWLTAGQLKLGRALWRQALECFASACKYSRRCGHARRLTAALERSAVAELELQRFSKARVFGRESLELARQHGLFDYECLAYERLIEIERRRTNWEPAFRLADDYLKRTRAAGSNVARAEEAFRSLER